MVLILATGLYLTADRWEFGDFFVSWGMLAIILLFGVVHGFFIPNTRRYVEAVEGGREQEAEAIVARMNVMGPVAALAVILTIYVMTAKPFL
jgi:small-conductance mechanosensitive channel